jgi:hypothetical protein
METVELKVITPIIDSKEYGIEETKALTISSAFAPKIAERDGLSEVYKNILTKEITAEVCLEAKETRLKLVKVRTGIDGIHKTEKAFYLASGKYVDALKNKLQLPIEQMEEKLKEIELFFENQEKERKEKIRSDRFNQLKEITEDPNVYPLSEMTEVSFEELKSSLELLAKQKVEKAKKEEEERAAKERLKLRIDSLIITGFSFDGNNYFVGDFKRLDEQSISSFSVVEFDEILASGKAELLRLRQIELDELKSLQEAKAKADAELAEQKRLAEIEAAKQAAILAEEKAKAGKLAAELKAKADAEEAEKNRIEAEEKAKVEAEKKAAKAPDKEKLRSVVLQVSTLKEVLPELKTEEGKKILENIKTLLDKVIFYTKEQTEKL